MSTVGIAGTAQKEWLHGHAFAWAVRETPYGGGTADEVANSYADWYVEHYGDAFAEQNPVPMHPDAFRHFQSEQIKKGAL